MGTRQRQSLLSLTRLVVDAANGTEGNRLSKFFLATACDEHVGAFSETELECNESDTAADARNEDILSLRDPSIDDGSSADAKSRNHEK